jgi:hypothetical protein
MPARFSVSHGDQRAFKLRHRGDQGVTIAGDLVEKQDRARLEKRAARFERDFANRLFEPSAPRKRDRRQRARTTYVVRFPRRDDVAEDAQTLRRGDVVDVVVAGAAQGARRPVLDQFEERPLVRGEVHGVAMRRARTGSE